MPEKAWLLRFAADVVVNPPRTMTADEAFAELDTVKRVLEAGGFQVRDYRSMCAPLIEEPKE